MIVTPFAQVGVPLRPRPQPHRGACLLLSTALTAGPGQSQDGPEQRGCPCTRPGQCRQVWRAAGRAGSDGVGCVGRGGEVRTGLGEPGEVRPSDAPVCRQVLLGTPPHSGQQAAPAGTPSPSPQRSGDSPPMLPLNWDSL